jgi:hypothetical protein
VVCKENPQLSGDSASDSILVHHDPKVAPQRQRINWLKAEIMKVSLILGLLEFYPFSYQVYQ